MLLKKKHFKFHTFLREHHHNSGKKKTIRRISKEVYQDPTSNFYKNKKGLFWRRRELPKISRKLSRYRTQFNNTTNVKLMDRDITIENESTRWSIYKDLQTMFAINNNGHEIFRRQICVGMPNLRFSCLIICFVDSYLSIQLLGLYIDEMLLSFKGRCKFIITYMPQKPFVFVI